MVKIGCPARFNHPYEEEVEFARINNFELMQVWYDHDGIRNHESEENRLDKIMNHGFPTIIHALLDMNEIERHTPRLIEILNQLKHKELIIHPICHSEAVNENTIYKLSEIIRRTLELLEAQGITLCLENNSKLEPLFSTSDEIQIMFAQNPSLEFLIDIAHIHSYEHLKEMISIKRPKMLHIADKHFDSIHEHLPLGHGELDFKRIFDEILIDYEGTIIFEVGLRNEDIIRSQEILLAVLMKYAQQ